MDGCCGCSQQAGNALLRVGGAAALSLQRSRAMRATYCILLKVDGEKKCGRLKGNRLYLRIPGTNGGHAFSDVLEFSLFDYLGAP